MAVQKMLHGGAILLRWMFTARRRVASLAERCALSSMPVVCRKSGGGKCEACRSVVVALDRSGLAKNGSNLDAEDRQDPGAGERGCELEPDQFGGGAGGHAERGRRPQPGRPRFVQVRSRPVKSTWRPGSGAPARSSSVTRRRWPGPELEALALAAPEAIAALSHRHAVVPCVSSSGTARPHRGSRVGRNDGHPLLRGSARRHPRKVRACAVRSRHDSVRAFCAIDS